MRGRQHVAAGDQSSATEVFGVVSPVILKEGEIDK